jgi:hypothetical protein
MALGLLTVFAIWRTWGSLPASGYAADEVKDLGSGDLYILSVGVEPRLTAKGKRDPYAGDAWFVRQALAQAEPLYATTHTRVLAGARATRKEVLEALAWLGKSVGERDVAVLFFSTHGDGVVTLAEVASYLPARAKGLYDKQNAISLLGELFDLRLAQINRNRPAVALWTPTPKPRKPAGNRPGQPDTPPR